MDNIKIRHRGLLVDYDPNGVHKSVIYFATDTQQLLLDGSNYGGSNTIIVDAIDTNNNSTDVIRFKLSTKDYKKAYEGSTTSELIVIFGDNIYFPGTLEEMLLLCFRYLRKNILVTNDVEKIWVVDNDYLNKLQKYAELTIYPVPDDDGMDCIINFETSTIADNVKKLQNQIDTEAAEILTEWKAKDGSIYTASSEDITTAIYDLDLALKLEEQNRVESDENINDKLEDIQPKVELMYDDLYKKEVNTGDAILVNKLTLEKIAVNPDNLNNYSPTNWEPIGVVAIPTSHNVYGTGECGVVALMSASCITPDTGNISRENINWGAYNINHPELDKFHKVPYYNRVPSSSMPTSILGESNNGLIPLQRFDMPVRMNCPHDSKAKYGRSMVETSVDGYLPSPYLDGDVRNPAYYQTESPSSTANALSDFAGKSNTEILCSKVTNLTDWKIATSITNSSNAGLRPAACACWRYKTIGTNSGDWYLPAMGELGYIPSRYDLINSTIIALQTWSSKSYCLFDTSSYWSSTEVNATYTYSVSLYIGYLQQRYHNSAIKVCPFLRLIPSNTKFYTKEEVDEIVSNLSEDINDKLEDKVDKVDGKLLSEEDFTSVYREKLDELIEGKLKIDLAYETTAKPKLQLALGLLTSTDTAQTLNDRIYIYHSGAKCEFKVTSLEYTNGNWIVKGASTVHEQGNRFFDLFSYTQSTNTLVVGAHEIDKASIGLGNVDNTSDANKPVSNAVNTRINNEISGLSLSWDSVNKKIVLKNKDNQSVAELDAAPFVKDGMIDSITISNDKLIITFNTDSDKTPLELPLSSFVNIYEGEKAITISDRKIKLKIDEGSTAYLKQGDSGLLFDDNFLGSYIKTDGSNGTNEGVSALIRKLDAGDSNPTDNTMIITSYSAGEHSTHPLYYRRPASYLWNYIKGKADNVYVDKTSVLTITGLKTLGNRVGNIPAAGGEVNRLAITPYGHTEGLWYINSFDSPSTAYFRLKYADLVPFSISHTGDLDIKGSIKAKLLTNEDLNTLKEGYKFYYAYEANTCANKPANGNFGLTVIPIGNSWIKQICEFSSHTYVRTFNTSTWSEWVELATTNQVSSSLGNYVTLNTQLAITGNKTFTGNINVNNTLFFKNPNRENSIYIVQREDVDLLQFSHHKNYSWQKNIAALDINGNWTMNGLVKLKGSDLVLSTPSTTSDDSGDLIWLYSNGNEKMRIWSDHTPSSASGPLYKLYDKNGTLLYNGKLVTAGLLENSITSHTHSQYLTSHQSLANYVTLDGSQTITGAKTFSSAITSSISNASLYWLSTTPRGKFVATGGGTNNGWSPVLAFKTYGGKLEFGSLNNDISFNYYHDTRTTNGVDYMLTLPKKTGTLAVTSDISSAVANYVPLTSYTDANVLAKIKNVDGSGSGLDADLLDGYHEDAFFRQLRADIPTAYIDLTDYNSGAANYANYAPGTYRIVRGTDTELLVNFTCPNSSCSGLQLKTSYDHSGGLFFRKTIDSNRVSGAWIKVITDLNIGSHNAGSATKLQTARMLWGLNFDGTNNVSGDMTAVRRIKGTNTEAPYIWLSNVPANAGNLGTAVGFGPSPYGYGLFIWGEGTGKGHIQVGRNDGNKIAYNLILQEFGGNVGIGTTAPSEKLEVAGNVKATNIITTNTDLEEHAQNNNSGLKHLPAGGEKGQFLMCNGEGTGVWVDLTDIGSGGGDAVKPGDGGVIIGGTTSSGYGYNVQNAIIRSSAIEVSIVSSAPSANVSSWPFDTITNNIGLTYTVPFYILHSPSGAINSASNVTPYALWTYSTGSSISANCMNISNIKTAITSGIVFVRDRGTSNYYQYNPLNKTLTKFEFIETTTKG